MADLNVTYVSLLIIVLLLATIQDIKKFAISNILTFTGMLAGLVLHMSYAGQVGLWYSARGLIAGFVIGEIAALITKMGQGDVFLLAALGSFIGPMLVMEAFLFTLTVLFIRFSPTFLKGHVLHQKVPVAPYIAIGTILALILEFVMQD